MEIVLIARARVAQRIKWNNVGPWSLRGSKCTADTTHKITLGETWKIFCILMVVYFRRKLQPVYQICDFTDIIA